ncbi:Hypothetical protein FKW44_012135, partial [Caligus rogercresseyi]
MLLEDEDELVSSGGGVYRVRDNISNFLIRVRIKRIEPYSLNSSGASSNEAETDDEAEDGEDTEIECVSLRWQQKRFSQEEVEKYGKSKESDFGDEEVLSKKFYHDVQKIKVDGSHKDRSRRIFSVIDGELSKEED